MNERIVYLEADVVHDSAGRIIARNQRWPIELPDNHPFNQELPDDTRHPREAGPRSSPRRNLGRGLLSLLRLVR
jgi:hypothetical protein